MSVTLDEQELFDERQLAIDTGSVKRDSIERTVSGLDGVLSIDLGERGRRIKQSGVLRAQSREKLQDKIDNISAFMDGRTHTLVSGSGDQFDNVRMDAFKVSHRRAEGGGACCDYEVIYAQLRV